MAEKTSSKKQPEPEQEPEKLSPHDVFGTPESDNSGIDWSDDTKDLTSLSGFWPGNPSQRQGSFYISLNRLALEKGETGIIGHFPEGFVFERVDVHCISVPDSELELSVHIGSKTPSVFVGMFYIAMDTIRVNRMGNSDTEPGIHVGGKNIYLKATTPIPANGRILIAFIGYQIEPWR